MHAGCPCLQPVKEYVKPHNQLRLSEAELEEELACSLTAGNPAAPSNVARYHLKDSTYKVCCSSLCLDSTLWLHSLLQWGQGGDYSPAVPHIWLILTAADQMPSALLHLGCKRDSFVYVTIMNADGAKTAACKMKACIHGPDQFCAWGRRACLLQVEHNVDQMLLHYSSKGWLTYKEPAAPLSRQTSVRVRPPVLTLSLRRGQPGSTVCCCLSNLVMCLGAISTAS